MSATAIDPVDEVLPAGRLFALGLQHVLVMYAGAIAVPLIIGGALKLPKDQIAFLISADLFCCGIVTLIQALGIWKFGIRLPVMMGVTFAAVGPMIAMANNPQVGILGIYGAVIAAGIFSIVVAPLMSSLARYFPPVVTGTIITVIGISLMRVGVNWAAGGLPTTRQMVDGALKEVPNPAYGAPENLAIALLVLVAILLITKYLKGFLANIAVLLGLIIGFVVALVLGKVSFAGLDEAKWFALVTPFNFGIPTFDPGAIVEGPRAGPVFGDPAGVDHGSPAQCLVQRRRQRRRCPARCATRGAGRRTLTAGTFDDGIRNQNLAVRHDR